MSQLASFSNQATPVVTNLGVAAPGLTRITKAVGPFARGGTASLVSLGKAADRAGPDLVHSEPVLGDLEKLANGAKPVSSKLEKLLTSLRKTGGNKYLTQLLFNTVGTVNAYDSYGHFIRTTLPINNCVDYVAQFGGGGGISCNANWLTRGEGTPEGVDGARPADRARRREGTPGDGSRELQGCRDGHEARRWAPVRGPQRERPRQRRRGRGRRRYRRRDAAAGRRARPPGQLHRRGGVGADDARRQGTPGLLHGLAVRAERRLPMRKRAAAGLAASPTMVGAVTVLVAIVAVFLAYNANNGLPFIPTYQVSVQVPDAASLVPGNDVRIGGVRVGVVESVEPEQNEDGKVYAKLNLKLDKSARADPDGLDRHRSGPLGARAEVPRDRQGRPLRGLPRGVDHPARRGDAKPVEIDQVLNTFDEPTRQPSSRTCSSSATRSQGAGRTLNAALGHPAPPGRARSSR